MLHGWIILDKPAGMTSTKAGSLVKRALKVKSLGHAGTLDPFATGILPLALGEATKVMPLVVADVKEYEFKLTFGEQRNSDDIDGQVIATTDIIPSSSNIQDALKSFTGIVTQIPPVYSALQIGGERACDRVRRGESVTMKSRQVEIHELELLEMLSPTIAKLRVLCGTGTYVRALGRDLALHLGSLAYLNALRRTRVGKFSLKNSVTLDTVLTDTSVFKDHQGDQKCKSIPWLLSIRDVLDDIPAFPVSDSDAIKIRQGQSILPETQCENQQVLLLHQGKELALANSLEGRFYPKKVFMH
jgi:tRNA pseudouridine55 synthase